MAPVINIAGLKIITNAKEIMRVVFESEKNRNQNLDKEKKEWLSFKDLKQKVREAGIVSKRQGSRLAKL